MRVLVTGAAGFIGSHVSAHLLARGDTVIGLDNMNAYYDPQLKADRLARLVRRTWVRVPTSPTCAIRTPLPRRSRPRRIAWCTWPRKPASGTR